MGHFFDIMTIAVTIIVVFLLIITAIHSFHCQHVFHYTTF